VRLQLFLFSAALAALLSLPDESYAQIKCGTKIKPVNREAQKSFIPGYFGCDVINSKDRTLQITVHICRDTLGSDNYDEDLLEPTIANLNELWQPIGIDFKICDIRYMDNFQFDEFEGPADTGPMTTMYYQQNTINLYLVESLDLDGFGEAGGLASLPGGTDFVIVAKEYMTPEFDVCPHEMGHFFGLYHTFEEDFGLELANGSNCETTGDLVCDTPANPSDDSEDAPAPDCTYIGSPVADANGDFYVPGANNIMSYYPEECTCKFTPQQYNRMLEQYLQLRSYLW
jgi:hypothetical protein